MSQRPITHRYMDPLDAVWLAAARRMGLTVIRSAEVYASTDGRGTLAIGAPETLDADDSLAQMILHEICHSLVEGPEGLRRPDWGLCNLSAADLVREHACLRLQAALADRHGLRTVLAPTTDHRPFYDRLGDDPLAAEGEPSVALARAALDRVGAPPWGPHLGRALSATAAIVAQAVDAGAGEVADADGRPLLYGGFSRGPAAERP
jgi:hypothetical protein